MSSEFAVQKQQGEDHLGVTKQPHHHAPESVSDPLIVAIE